MLAVTESKLRVRFLMIELQASEHGMSSIIVCLTNQYCVVNKREERQDSIKYMAYIIFIYSQELNA